MQMFALLASAAVMVWLIFAYGIEAALTFATVLSGAVWLGYRVFDGKAGDEKNPQQEAPLLLDYSRSFFPIFLIVLVLRSFVAEPFRIPSGSMMPTLLAGDFILVNKFSYGIRLPVLHTKILDSGEPARGDVAVFRFPKDPSSDFIKRIVGVPGDHIAYRRKTLFVNGEPMPLKPLAPYRGVDPSGRARGSLEAEENLTGVTHSVLVNPFAPDFSPSCDVLTNGGLTVPEGHYFAMGDNRDDSNDGRCWGLVPEENLVGRAMIIWLSLNTEHDSFIGWGRLGQSID